MPEPTTGQAEAEPEMGVPAPVPVSFRGMLFGSGPRFARDAFGPLLAFYVGWKLVGLVAGVLLATALSLLAYRHERRHERSGLIVRFSLVFVVLQAIIGIASGSARVYLAQPVLLNGVMGLAFLGSVAAGRPLAGVFAQELYPFPPEVRASDTFRRVFGRVSLAWGAYLLVRSVVRLVTLTTSSVESYLVVNLLTGIPLTAGLMTWSMWYGVRGFRSSEEWGWALDGEAAG